MKAKKTLSKRTARRRALRMPNGIDYESASKRDSMGASRRNWGQGESLDAHRDNSIEEEQMIEESKEQNQETRKLDSLELMYDDQDGDEGTAVVFVHNEEDNQMLISLPSLVVEDEELGFPAVGIDVEEATEIRDYLDTFISGDY